MNTIPTTLESRSVPYTVVGGASGGSQPAGKGISILVLSRGQKLYRAELFHDLERLGFESILSIEEASEAVDVESLAQRHPSARFILLGQPISPGEMVNLGMRESQSPYVFVLWSDMRLQSQALSSRFFERVAEQDLLCISPFLQAGKPEGGGKPEVLPSALAPALHRQSLKVLALAPEADGVRSLYPFDYCGIYSRQRFVLTGGFDGGLANPYWQKLDFGFRSWLWGEEIRLSQALRVAYEDLPPAEDSTVDRDYKWFWLKNLAPSYRSDHGLIPTSRFWSYLRRRSGGPFSALGEFRAAQEWVELNRFRFRQDAASLVEFWGEGDA